MMNPARPTEKYILGRIRFHEDQASWFRDHNEPKLAAWSQSIADTWRNKLEAPK
jgi:hypothetical protein